MTRALHKLEEAIVVITGASSGIGRATAPQPPTPGNLFQPTPRGTSAAGGWSEWDSHG